MGFLNEIIQNISVFVGQISSTLKTAISRIEELLAGDFFGSFGRDFLTFFSAPFVMAKNYFSHFPYAVLVVIIIDLLLATVFFMLVEKMLVVIESLDWSKISSKVGLFFKKDIIQKKTEKRIMPITKFNTQPISFAQALLFVSFLAFLAYSLPQKFQLANLATSLVETPQRGVSTEDNKILAKNSAGQQMVLAETTTNLDPVSSAKATADQGKKTIQLTGLLTDKDGQPVDGTYETRLAIYSKDRTELDNYPSDGDKNARIWEETRTVDFKKGIFNIDLGTVKDLPILTAENNGQFYLGMRIGTDSEMIPRKKIGTPLFALNAGNAILLNGKKLGTNPGDIIALNAQGQIDIQNLPVGKNKNQLVAGNDKRLKYSISGANFVSLSGQTFKIKKINLADDISGILDTSYGGLGQNSYAVGDMLYYATGNKLSKLAIGDDGQMLIVRDGVPAWSSKAPATSHSLLSLQHPDTTPAIVQRGDLVTGQGASATWSRLALGTSGQYLRSDGTDAVWDTLTKATLGLGNVENTTLSTWSGTENITTLGNITTGTWNSTTVSALRGGTGISLYAVGDLLYASGTETLAKLAIGENGKILGVVNGAPAWISALSGVWNGEIIGAAYGGTGIDGSTAGNGKLLIGKGTGYDLANISASTGISVTNGPGTIMLTNTGVTSLAGDIGGNQITMATSTGAITLRLPQDIATTSNVHFGSLVLDSPLQVGYGGTGRSQFNLGDIPYFASDGSFTSIALGAAGQVLTLSGGIHPIPSWSDNATAAPHNLLSDKHSDATTGTVTRGDLIAGQVAVPGDPTKWSRFALGQSGYYLKSNGTDIVWSALDTSWSGSTIDVAHGGTGTNVQFTPGSVVFAGASGIYAQDNANFFYDISTHRLGLGITNPQFKLDVSGDVNIASGNNFKINGVQIAMNNLGDVTTASPGLNDVLSFNGSKWVNVPLSNGGTGTGIGFFLDDTASGTGGYASIFTSPGTGTEVADHVDVNNGNSPVSFDNYISAASGLGGVQIDAGIWEFDTYAWVDDASGNSAINIGVYKRTSLGDETLLFSTTTGEINNTAVALITTRVAEQAFAINATDRLVVKYTGVTNNVGTVRITMAHNGTTHYSYLIAPLITRHNNLAGLQGGAANEYYHLTGTEYTGTGSGTFARATAPTFTTQITAPVVIGASTSDNALVLQGTSATGNTPTNANLQFKVGNAGGTTALTVLNNGNVGIGTTSPNALFSIGTTSQFQVDASGNLTATSFNGNTLSGTGSLSLSTYSLTLSGNTTLNQPLTNTSTPAFNGLTINGMTSGVVINASGVFSSEAQLAIARGGTGTNSAPLEGQLLIGKTGGTYDVAYLSASTGITIANGNGSITVSNAGVYGLHGTDKQVNVTATTGDVTLSLPQSIATDSAVQFGSLTLSASALSVGSGGTGTNSQFTQGSVVYAGSAGVYAQDNANFFWDATTHRLGIGTTTPGSTLSIASTSNAYTTGTLFSTSLSQDKATGTVVSGNIASIAFSPTYSTAITTPTISGNVLNIARNAVASVDFNSTLTISGAVASFSDSATQSQGTLVSTADVVQILQSYSSNSGSALNIAGGGGATGFALRVNDNGTFTDSTPFVVDNGGNVGIGTTNPLALLAVGATSQFQVSSAGAITAVGVNSGSGLIQGTGGLTITGTITLPSSSITNANLANSTISGIALGTNLATLTFGTHLTGTSYNGSTGVTIATDATDANTVSTLVARDASGNFSAGTITASITGASSLNVLKAGDTMTGGITNSTSLNPLTTLAESWIGPSSTTGIYFKGGNVGVGTTTPGAKLDIMQSGAVTTNNYATYINNTASSSTDAINKYGIYVASSGTWNGIGANSYLAAFAGSLGNVLFDANGADMQFSRNSTNYITASNASGSLILRTGGTNTRLNIDASGNFAFNTNQLYIQQSNGNVGIGTTSPGQLLELSNSGNATLRLRDTSALGTYFDIGTSAGSGGLSISQSGTQVMRIRANGNFNFGTGATPNNRLEVQKSGTTDYFAITSVTSGDVFQVLNNGNVGIGTASPAQKLEISDANPVRLYLTNTGGGVTAALKAAAAGAYFGTVTNQKMVIQTNDTDRVTIDTSGNVGIGTTAPAYVLDVQNAAGANTMVRFLNTTAGADSKITIGNSDGKYSQFTQRGGTTGSGSFTGVNGFSVDIWGGSNSVGVFNNDGTVALGGTITDHSTFAGAKMVINSSGNVGIGTTAPGQKLDILSASSNPTNTTGGIFMIRSNDAQAADIGGSIALGGYRDDAASIVRTWAGINGYKENSTTNNAAGYLALSTNTNAALTEAVRITSGQNVGIGTTMPGTRLEVAKATQDLTPNSSGVAKVNLALTATDAEAADIGGALGFGGQYITSSSANILYAAITGRKDNATSTNADGYLAFHTWLTNGLKERMRIDKNGNVGIGTTNPGYALDVNGIMNTVTGSSGGYAVAGAVMLKVDNNSLINVGSGSSGNGIGFFPGSSPAAMTILKISGNVGIGTTSPGYRLDVPAVSASNYDVAKIGGFVIARAATDVNNLLMTGANFAGGTTGTATATTYSAYQQTSGSHYFYTATGQTIGNALTGSVIPMTIVGTGAVANTLYLTAGNVGIGTTGPGYKLDVYDASGYTARFREDGDAIVAIAGGTSGATQLFSIRNDGAGPVYLNTQNSRNMVLGVSSGTGAGTTVAGVTIQQSGNVGIGTTSPASKLHTIISSSIASSVSFTTSDWDTGGSTGSGMLFRTGATSGNTYSSIAALVSAGSASGNLVLNPAGGNVGIGTTGPSVALQVNSGTFPQVRVSANDTNAGSGIIFTNAPASAYNWLVGSQHSVSQGFEITPSTAVGGTTFSTPAITVLSGGNVGIGTTGAGAKLHIKGGNANNLLVDNDGSQYTELDIANNSTVKTSWYWDNSSSVSRFNTTGTFSFMNGNIGIGTTGPRVKTEIMGTITDPTALDTMVAAGSLVLSNSTSGTVGLVAGIASYGNTYPTYLQARYLDTTNAARSLLLNPLGGNVGIGTTAPLTLLDVAGQNKSIRITDTRDITWAGNEQMGALEFYSQDASAPGVHITASIKNIQDNGVIVSPAGSLAFYTAASSATETEKVRITSTGNVGIGTTVPGSLLTVAGTIRSDSSGTPEVYLNKIGTRGWSIRNDGAFNIYNWETATNQLTVLNSGNVGIGTTNPTHLIMLSGGAYSDGTNWTNGSDRNSKENFATLDPQSVLEKIATLPITQWNYKVEPNATMHIGPMAQDFYAAFGLGGISGNTSISTIDPSGVALLGIQALNTKTNNFITQANNQITGLTDNQNKIVNQLTGQLADQNLSVDSKLQLIGASLDELTTKQIATLKDQITAQTSDISDLKDQIKLLQDETKSVIDFQIAFNLGNVIIKDNLGNINLLEGKITASDIEALHTITATDIKATNSLEGQKLKLGTQTSGTSMIKAGELESAKILTTEAAIGIKLYITPKGSTQGKTLFYDESDIDPGVGFKVKIDAPALDKNVEFNWLIVK